MVVAHRNLNTFLNIIYRLALLSCFIFVGSSLRASPCTLLTISSDTIPEKTPEKKKSSFNRYLNVITDQQQRDSLLSKLGRKDVAAPQSDSMIWKFRENTFSVFRGKKIRYIYYNQLKVFGTTIEDTAVAQNKLVHFGNRLHYNTREWMIHQSLFFSEGDTVNAYKMVDNERYLRRLPFIQDARIYVINSYESIDSIDIVVLTKDVFEYGGSLNQLDDKRASATVFNNNVLGAGQKISFGASWDKAYMPQWRTAASYTKYNIGGTFTDASIGYTLLNDKPTADTSQYEKAAYININRPLYTVWAEFTGGLTLSVNQSMNVNSLPDSLYRSYAYNLVDVWGGYNFNNQFTKTGYNRKHPNIGVELRSFNMNFTRLPTQDTLKYNPNYNSHNYLLGSLVFFHQEFYKTNYFFGFGRTEDIPLGYTYSASFGLDKWMGLKRTYMALQGQKFWLPGKNLISTTVGFGGYWWNQRSQDAVLHIQSDYYSNLFSYSNPKIREFLHADYIICLNDSLYKPVNINKENGIFGYRYTLFNNFQRLNLSAQTNYYSPINIYGFKFNFYLLLQASLLASNKESIFKSHFYQGYTIGCQIRNENLSFNTFQISASYQPLVDHGPQAANGPSSIFIFITSVTAFNFPIFALQQPTLIQYR